eukprot:scaffold19562_cov75-Cyclotella_meneghiniana.AAC.4
MAVLCNADCNGRINILAGIWPPELQGVPWDGRNQPWGLYKPASSTVTCANCLLQGGHGCPGRYGYLMRPTELEWNGVRIVLEERRNGVGRETEWRQICPG